MTILMIGDGFSDYCRFDRTKKLTFLNGITGRIHPLRFPIKNR